MLIRSIAFATIIPISGCMVFNAGPTVTGSGVAKSENRVISGVTKIKMSKFGTLILKQSDKESLTVKGDDNIVPLMESKVAGDTLTLGLTQEGSFNPKVPMEYVIELKSLIDVELTGAVTAKISELDGKSIRFSVTGASNVTCAGKTDTLTISGTGACKADALGLACKKATVTLTGASSAFVNVEESLDVTATGACKVTYLGDPKVTKNVTGASSIDKKQ